MPRPTAPIQRYGTALGLGLLLAFTVYSFWGASTVDCLALLSAWRDHPHEAVLALAISVAGIAADCVAWTCAWRAQGIVLPPRIAVSLYFSGAALQLLPLQLSRVMRAALAFRSGRATLRQALSAEAVLFGLDLVAIAGLLAAFMFPWPGRPAAVIAVLAGGPAALWLGDRVRPLLALWIRHLSGTPFLSFANVLSYYARVLDWLSLSFLLYIVGSVTLPGLTWQSSGTAALGASIAGAASTLPAGLGINEAVLALGMGGSDGSLLPERGIAVFAYRLLSFWIWIPAGWWGLWMFRRQTARKTSPHA